MNKRAILVLEDGAVYEGFSLGSVSDTMGEVMGIDTTSDAALAKTLQAAGLMIPPEGAILFSITDRDNDEALPIIGCLANLGFRLYVTEGTAKMIESSSLPVIQISKRLSEGHPNIVDIIRDGTINGIVNTITGGSIPLRDSFHIRRAAAEKRIPFFTSLDTARVTAAILSGSSQSYSARPLSEYRREKTA